jgi:hypothetical protein
MLQREQQEYEGMNKTQGYVHRILTIGVGLL